MKILRLVMVCVICIVLLASTVFAQTVASGAVSYTKTLGASPFPFCSTSFSSSNLRYNGEGAECVMKATGTVSDLPASCFVSDVSFNNQMFSMGHNDNFLLADSPFAVSMIASAEVIDGELQDGWSIRYNFALQESDFLNSRIVNADTVVQLNNRFDIAVETSNTFLGCDGGFFIKATPRLFPVEETFVFPAFIEKDKNVVGIPFDPTNLGNLDIESTAFLTIGGVRFFDSFTSKKSFYISPNLLGALQSNCVSNSDCGLGFQCERFRSGTTQFNVCSVIDQTSQTDTGLSLRTFAIVFAITTILGVALFGGGRTILDALKGKNGKKKR